MEQQLQNYGFWGVVAWIILRDVIPPIVNKVWPKHIQAEQSEREWQHKQEERIVSAMEKMTLAITANNERMSQVINLLERHDAYTVTAVTEMKERVTTIENAPKKPRKATGD